MKNTKQKFLAAGIAAVMAATAQHAYAASDGTLGATSTGTSIVSLTIGAVYQITGLADLALGTYGGAGDMTGNDDVCVYTNDVSGNYNVTITDDSTMSAAGFSVQNAGATEDIAYSVDWNDVAGTVGSAAVTYNTQLASTGADTASATCSGGNNANFEVTVAAAALGAASADTYTATMSILIEP